MLAFLGDLGLPELMVLVVSAALILARDRGSPSVEASRKREDSLRHASLAGTESRGRRGVTDSTASSASSSCSTTARARV